MNQLDPTFPIDALYNATPRRLTFNATSRDEAQAWQRELRPRLVELLGGIPRPADDLAVAVEDVQEFPAYRRERISFASRPGERVVGYLLTPRGEPPFPVMICIPGHGRGVDDIVGIDENGAQRTEKAGYSGDFAIQAVEYGMAAVAIESLGFGHRRDPATAQRGSDVSACHPVGAAALLFGQTIIAWRVHDIMRTIDWVETRRELAADRIGCMGISGGGMCTLFGAALEPRITVAFVSGYLNTFRASIASLPHCVDNYVPGILDWCEMYDVAGLIAPRPLFAEFGERDPIFPPAASQDSADRVRTVYETFGVGENFGYDRHPGEHEFSGRLGLPFCTQHLADPNPDVSRYRS